MSSLWEYSYLLSHLLTSKSRVLLEKLTGSQLVKKFSAFCGIWSFITEYTSVRHLALSSGISFENTFNVYLTRENKILWPVRKRKAMKLCFKGDMVELFCIWTTAALQYGYRTALYIAHLESRWQNSVAVFGHCVTNIMYLLPMTTIWLRGWGCQRSSARR